MTDAIPMRRATDIDQVWNTLIEVYAEVGADQLHGFAEGSQVRSGDGVIALVQTVRYTSDTYTSLLPELGREVAEMAARPAPRARQNLAADGDSGVPAHASLTHEPGNEAAPGSTEAEPGAA